MPGPARIRGMCACTSPLASVARRVALVATALLALGCGGGSVAPAPSSAASSAASSSSSSSASSSAEDPSPSQPPLPAVAAACEAFASAWLEHGARLGDDAVVWAHRYDPRGPEGYAPSADVHTVEVRSLPGFEPRWRRVMPSYVVTMAVSPDASRIAVATSTESLVLDARDGAVLARIEGSATAIALGADGTFARGVPGAVTVHSPPSYVEARSHPITGTAPTVIHAMRTDGECDEIHDETAAMAGALAMAEDGTVFAGISDGSVRTFGATERRFDLPGARAGRDYATQAILLVPRSPSELVTVWGDGRVVILDRRTLRPRASLPGTCSAAEAARFRVATGRVCGNARCTAVDGDRVATPGRVRTLSGAELFMAQTLHENGVILVGDRLFDLGNGGTVEEWRLDGRFVGHLPLPGRSGWVRDVSPEGRYVALAFATRALPLERVDDAGTQVRIWDTTEERELEALRRPGPFARFVGADRVALQSPSHIEIAELATGRVTRTIAIGTYQYAGLVGVFGSRLVVSDDAGRARVIDAHDGVTVEVSFGGGTLTGARLEGDLLAALIFEAPPSWNGSPAHRLELFSLEGGRARRLHRIDGVSDGSLVLDEDAAFFVRGGVATRIDLATGEETPIRGIALPIRWLGRIGGEWVVADALGTHLSRRGRPYGPPVLSIARIDERPDATLLYETNGLAYVVGPDGEARGSVDAMDGGFVVRSGGGHAASAPIASAALASRRGELLVECDAPARLPRLLERLVAGR